MTLESPVTELKGVGDAVARKFSVLGIKTIADLIDYYPRRYDDYSEVTKIAHLKPGAVTIEAEIKQVKGRYVRRGMHITEAVASDDTGSVRLVWFNQPYRENAIEKEQPYFISGTFELSHQRFAIMSPSTELVSDFPVNTARIIPIYRETKGLNSRQIRTALKQVLSLIRVLPETLPDWLVHEQKLLPYAEAIAAIHFPASSKQLAEARRRLGFEEVFALTLASLLNKQEVATEVAVSVPFDEKVAQDFVKHLPFPLTGAQRKSVWQLYQDMQRTQPMNRLVEGDVGSGKTVVAAMAGVMVLNAGKQVALMAPTELLARQHAETIQKLLEPLGYGDTVGLLVGGMTTAQKNQAHEAIKDGRTRFIIGTHALIQEKVDMQELELIIVDEQHRFGVEQRKKLMAKAGHMPHVLSLTATPIPRSLALTLYGELDVSVLDEKPAGRQPIVTEIVSPNSTAQLYKTIDEQLERGRQMFVVCPLITESATLDVNSAEKVYETMRIKTFKHRRVGLLHGKMKPQEKNDIMQQFIAHELDILVSTTVIEVGVDVPNATIMLIEAAERFGLAQIHQLRGRVGRGEHQGFCYLMMSDSKAPSPRLRALERSQDGFKLAELDLEMRGPGAIYGTMQHGQLDLRIAKLTDVKLIAAARASAQEFLDRDEKLLQYEQMWQRVNKLRAVTNLN
ncbi:MAG TPA: ATP-dependent DNA helicase RecG [Candidatus Saccharimonadales bacterium]|nr:ATP-dependent DNA helicase RecG [Candidatus Saccharimonadales bacterium]